MYYNTADNAATQAEKHNFRDLENLWIAINPQSGLTSTAEVADVNDSAITGTTSHEFCRTPLSPRGSSRNRRKATGGR